MASGRKALRAWREAQTPRVSHKALGARFGKSASLVRMYESGKIPLQVPDCIALSEITGIPLRQLLTPEQRREIERAASLLADSGDRAA